MVIKQIIRKYKNMVSLFVAGSLAVSILGSSGGTVRAAETGYSYTLYEESTGEGTAVQKAEITGYTGSETELSIPKKVDGYDVGSIGTGAFKENGDIVSAVIPEGVSRIGYEAFLGCERLEKLTIPSTVTDWDDDSDNSYYSKAFEGCLALREVTLSEGLTVLGQRAFYGCTSLEKVTVPSTIKEFHNQVFYGCTALRDVELKEGIRHMGYQAFGGCTALEEVDIPSTIEGWGQLRANGIMATLHDSAPFIGCTSLARVTFADGLKTLKGFQGVRNCPLVTELNVPASVEDIEYAFTDCSNLEKVTMGEGIQKIGTSAFQNCSALRQVNVPNTVVSLGANAFNGCSSLECLILPPSAVSLEGSVTAGCTSLKELYLLADAVNWYQALNFSSEGKLYCMEGSRTYSLYRTNMSESARQRLAVVPSAGGEAEGWELTYDGSPHPAVTVKGTEEGDEILYRVNDGYYQWELPEITEPGTYSVDVMVKRRVQGAPMQYSALQVQSRIQKRQYSMQLSDMEVAEGDGYTVNHQGYQGDGEPVFTYYNDSRCSQACDGKPEAAGVYYVKAYVAETDHDLAVESNVAKITIHGIDSGTDPSPAPDGNQGTDPGNTPSQEPGGSGQGSMPSQEPGGSDQGSAPSQEPGGSGQGSAPSPDPGGSGQGSTPSPKPGGTNPSANPGGNSGGDKQGDQDNKAAQKPKVKRVSLAKVKPGKKKVTVGWKKVSGASGYQVQVARNKKFTKGKKSYLVKKGKTVKKTVNKLKRKKIYYVRVRGYCVYQGQKIYGKWSKVKKVKVK